MAGDGRRRMGIVERTREIIRSRLRSFVLGTGAIEPADLYFGKTGEEWQPPEYGDYLATSNPVYFCSTLRAQLLTRLPLRLYRNEKEVLSGKLYELLKKVNPFWTWGRLLRMTELSLCLWGEAFWFIERGRSGLLAPREIWWGRPDRVVVVPDEVDYVSRFLYRPVNGNRDIPFYPREVVWFQYDNPMDEFEGLAPLAATLLAADTRNGAIKSNYNLFVQGMQMGGAIMPKNGVVLTETQAQELEQKVDRRYRGVDKAHKWGVFRMEVAMNQAGVTPKDAEFLGLLQMTLEDACRAYKVPLDIAGGQRSYENYKTALMAVWELCIVPEASFIAEQVVENLLPMAPGEADDPRNDTRGRGAPRGRDGPVGPGQGAD